MALTLNFFDWKKKQRNNVLLFRARARQVYGVFSLAQNVYRGACIDVLIGIDLLFGIIACVVVKLAR